MNLLIGFLLVVCILMQPSKADSGIGSAFGGQATDALFGANTPTVLAKFTAWLTVVFFVLSFLLAILIASRAHEKSLSEKYLGKGSNAPAQASKPGDNTPGKPAVPASTSPVEATQPATPETAKPAETLKSTETPAPAAPATPGKPTTPASP